MPLPVSACNGFTAHRRQPRHTILIGEQSVHVVTCAFVAGMWDKFEGAGDQQYTPW